MRPLKHGYTNRTLADGTVVKKSYAGPDAALRLRRERALLPHLQDQLPAPPVLGATATTLKLGFLAGTPGQELLDAGHAAEVMASCGKLLRRIQALTPPVRDLGTRRAGEVLVHGDFGPNNLLLDPGTFEATAVVDWEFAHFGTPVEDLAWCEELRRFCERWEADGPGARQWRERAAVTAAWDELPGVRPSSSH
ncbi:phosphotransferase family protein [Streptomyces sp. NPDC002795]|uniref:phosphotransferase family protein n=1 Tax=Streptomyces sp. NPDC002795 TaxID=3364665 RepID=UPI00369E259B